MTLIASGCFAVFFSSWSKPLLRVYSPLRLMAYSMAITSLVLWITIPFFPPHRSLDQVGARSWYALGYAIVFSGIVGHVLWYEGISRIGVARTMVYSFFVPIWAVLFNHFFLGEKLYIQQIIGGALILWGVRTALRN